MMTEGSFGGLLEAVRANCLLSDARHAQEQTLCNYLLAMREYYRWEHRLALDTEPPRAQVLRWIAEREAQWEAVEAHASWTALPLAGGATDPFDAVAANAKLLPEGLVYGAGIGRFGKPHFFLGALARRELRDGVEILESGQEFARDIEAAPAVLQDRTIFLRREAFERWLWLRAETWESRENARAMGAALAAYGFDADRAGALARMAESERETLILHELGEDETGRRLGQDWVRLMGELCERRAEIAARAVRDLLADCLVTLPALVARAAVPSLHFWFANFAGLRRALFPRLADAGEKWSATGERHALEEAIAAGREHWERVARQLAAEGLPAARRIAEAEAAFRLA
jgi:hypothetical protein